MPTLREIFNKPVLQSYVVQRDPMAETRFMQSGAFVSDARLRTLLTSGSRTFEVPYIMPLDGRLEANYGNTVYTDIAMPRTITGGKMQGRAAYMNEGLIESTLERFLLQKSPLAMMADQINDLWRQQMEYRAIATIIGLRNYDQANGKLLTTDISKATADATSGFSVDAFIDAEATMPEAYRGRGLMVIHPLIAAKLRKQQLVERVTTSDNLPPLSVYNGRAIVESDRQTVIGTGANRKFVTYLLGAGSFAADIVDGPEDLELERTAATGNGSGHTTLWTRRNAIIHPQGFSFVLPENELTGGTKNEALSPNWEDLTKPNAWRLDPKNHQGEPDTSSIPFRFLITNL